MIALVLVHVAKRETYSVGICIINSLYQYGNNTIRQTGWEKIAVEVFTVELWLSPKHSVNVRKTWKNHEGQLSIPWLELDKVIFRFQF